MSPTETFTVGIGRPFIYAYSAYGVNGVDRAITILKVSGEGFPSKP